MHEQQSQAGAKSGLVRMASSKLGNLLANDIDCLLAQISSGVIGSIKLEPESIQNILCRGAGAALEAQCRSNAALAEIRERHRNRIEIEEIRHRNREQARANRNGLTNVISDSNPDYMSTSALMTREGTQEEAISATVLSRPPAGITFQEWYEVLNAKQRRIVVGWFESEIDINSASDILATYVYDNMNVNH